MLKPPINDLVEKITEELGPQLGAELGNRYSLVLAIAKRAREIALEEDKEKGKEPISFESRITDRYKTAKDVVKPIHKAIDEFAAEIIEVYQRSPEEIKAEENEEDVLEDVAPVISQIDFIDEEDDEEEITEE